MALIVVAVTGLFEVEIVVIGTSDSVGENLRTFPFKDKFLRHASQWTLVILRSAGVQAGSFLFLLYSPSSSLPALSD